MCDDVRQGIGGPVGEGFGEGQDGAWLMMRMRSSSQQLKNHGCHHAMACGLRHRSHFEKAASIMETNSNSQKLIRCDS